MKRIVFGMVILLSACDPIKPDYVDSKGNEYMFSHPCVKSHTESKYEYHYGYNMMNGKWNYHWGMNTETICDSTTIDTIQINLDKKYYAKK